MFTDMDVTTLQQQIAEAQPGEKVLYCMELARRFRDGIGVEQDEEEALFWENYCRTEEAIPQETEVVSDYSAIEICDNPEVRSGAAAYQSYCTGDPAGIYSYAAYLDQKGEKRQAEEIYQELIVKLEQGMGVDYDYHSGRTLLTKAKYAMGRACAEDQTRPDAQKRAISYTEEAVLELNYYQGIPQLIALYRLDGLDKHEQKLLPMLEKMEDGNVDQRVVALDTYCELQRWGLASAAALGLLTEETTPQIWSRAAAFIGDVIRRNPRLEQNPDNWIGSDLGQQLREQNLGIDPEVYTPLPRCEDGLDFTVAENCERVSNHTLRRLVKADNLYAIKTFAQRICEMGDYRSVFEMLSRACTLIETEANVVGVGDSNCAGVIYWLYGVLYELGWGCRSDAKKAFEAIHLAAVKYGNQDARFRLFTLYRDGLGTEKDLDEATRILTKYAEAGNLRERANAAACFANIGKNANAEIWGQIVLQGTDDPKIKADALHTLQKAGGEDNEGKPVTADYIADLAERGDSAARLVQLYADIDACKDYLTDRTDLKIQQGNMCPGIVVSIDLNRNITVDLHGMGIGVLPSKKAIDMEFRNSREGRGLYNDVYYPMGQACSELSIGDMVLVRLVAYDEATGRWDLRFCKKDGVYDYSAFLPMGQAVLRDYNQLVQVHEQLADPYICKAVEEQIKKCEAMVASAECYNVLQEAKRKWNRLEEIGALKNGMLCGKPVDIETLTKEICLDSTDLWARAAALYIMVKLGEVDASGNVVTPGYIADLAEQGDSAAILAEIYVYMASLEDFYTDRTDMTLRQGEVCQGIITAMDERCNAEVDLCGVGKGVIPVGTPTDIGFSNVPNNNSNETRTIGDKVRVRLEKYDAGTGIWDLRYCEKQGVYDYAKCLFVGLSILEKVRLLGQVDEQLAEYVNTDSIEKQVGKCMAMVEAAERSLALLNAKKKISRLKELNALIPTVLQEEKAEAGQIVDYLRELNNQDQRNIGKGISLQQANLNAQKRQKYLDRANQKLYKLKLIEDTTEGVLLGKPVDVKMMANEVHLDSTDPWARAAAMYTLLVTQEPDAEGRKITEQQIDQMVADGDPVAIMVKIEQLRVAEQKIIPPYLLRKQSLQKDETISGVVISIDEEKLTFCVGPDRFVKIPNTKDFGGQVVGNLSVGDYAVLAVQQDIDLQHPIISASFLKKTGQLDFAEASAVSVELMRYYRQLYDLAPQLAESIPMENSIMWSEKLQILCNNNKVFSLMRQQWEKQSKKNRAIGCGAFACMLFLLLLFLMNNREILGVAVFYIVVYGIFALIVRE